MFPTLLDLAYVILDFFGYVTICHVVPSDSLIKHALQFGDALVDVACFLLHALIECCDIIDEFLSFL